MTINLETVLSVATKLLPLALSFVDDLLLFLLMKLGILGSGFSWLSPLFLTLTILFYLGQQIIKYRNTGSEIVINAD